MRVRNKAFHDAGSSLRPYVEKVRQINKQTLPVTQPPLLVEVVMVHL